MWVGIELAIMQDMGHLHYGCMYGKGECRNPLWGNRLSVGGEGIGLERIDPVCPLFGRQHGVKLIGQAPVARGSKGAPEKLTHPSC